MLRTGCIVEDNAVHKNNLDIVFLIHIYIAMSSKACGNLYPAFLLFFSIRKYAMRRLECTVHKDEKGFSRDSFRLLIFVIKGETGVFCYLTLSCVRCEDTEVVSK